LPVARLHRRKNMSWFCETSCDRGDADEGGMRGSAAAMCCCCCCVHNMHSARPKQFAATESSTYGRLISLLLSSIPKPRVHATYAAAAAAAAPSSNRVFADGARVWQRAPMATEKR
jgi:hypothetical protein